MRTLPVGLGTVARSGGDTGLDMAGAVVGFLPTFIVFLLGQRYIIQGVSLRGCTKTLQIDAVRRSHMRSIMAT